MIQNAQKGDAVTQYNLGVCYSKGEGVVQDKKEAVKWYRLAAESGDADAQYNLRVCYSKGEGATQNKGEAYFWYLIAAANGDEQAQHNSEIVVKELSSAEKSQIQSRATKWFEEHNK